MTCTTATADSRDVLALLYNFAAYSTIIRYWRPHPDNNSTLPARKIPRSSMMPMASLAGPDTAGEYMRDGTGAMEVQEPPLLAAHSCHNRRNAALDFSC